MHRNRILVVAIALSVVNGIFSPYLAVVVAFSPVWMPNWTSDSPSLLFYASSLIAASTTLLLAGVPAALLERAVPAWRGGPAMAWCWAGGAFLLSLPGLARAFAML
jgi:hypothetical protein